MVDFVYKENYVFDDLVKLVEILREHCPWDREQTHSSIRRNLLEEAYEAAEAIDLEDTDLLKEELGDVLLQVVFHAQMEREKEIFDIDSVCNGVCKKLIVRHPHIFGDAESGTASEVLEKWDEIKRKEKGQATHTEAIRSVARSLPALWRSEKIIEKAEKSELLPETDVPVITQHLVTLLENITSNREDEGASSTETAELTIGRILFKTVELARRLKVDPEEALVKTCDRFTEDFSTVEKVVSGNPPMEGADEKDLTELWLEVESKNS